MDLGTFCFETKKALSSICLSDTVYKFSVDGELHRSVDSDNHVAIPSVSYTHLTLPTTLSV